MIKVILEVALFLSLLAGGSTYVLKRVYVEARELAFEKIAQGLPSMSRMAEKMTCIRYDKNYVARKITTGYCKDKWSRKY